LEGHLEPYVSWSVSVEGELKLTIFELEVVVMLAPSLIVSDNSPALKRLRIDPSRNSVFINQLIKFR
jgi:hypothetical protein